MDRRILVHACCGPCSTASIERLLEDGWNPVLFFSNSNIWPEDEFRIRFENLLIVARRHGLEVMLDDYRHEEWLAAIKGYEEEHEGGARCTRCFRYNLLKAEAKAKELGIHHFCTTLTVSRFKNSAKIFREGEDLEGFEKIDFKKKNGFSRSCELAKEYGLYRQKYCGCEFSIRDAVDDGE